MTPTFTVCTPAGLVPPDGELVVFELLEFLELLPHAAAVSTNTPMSAAAFQPGARSR
jgi:hypothetical protein